jgi:transposase
LTGGHRNDVTQLLPLIDAVKPIRSRVGRPRKRPSKPVADRGYDHDKYRREPWRRGIKPVIGRRASEHGSRLGKQRWIVEAAVNFLHQFRRLRIRWERDPEMHLAFLLRACSLLCWRRLVNS